MAAKFTQYGENNIKLSKIYTVNSQTKTDRSFAINKRSKNYIFAICPFSFANLAVSLHQQPNLAILPEVPMFTAKNPGQMRYH